MVVGLCVGSRRCSGCVEASEVLRGSAFVQVWLSRGVPWLPEVPSVWELWLTLGTYHWRPWLVVEQPVDAGSVPGLSDYSAER